MTRLLHAVYGDVPRDLVDIPDGCVPCSPRTPDLQSAGASLLADMPPASCASIIVHAPPSTIERRCVMAHALRALAIDGQLTVLAANTKGGTRIADELTAFGCRIETSHKRRHQLVSTTRSGAEIGLDQAIADGAPRLLADVGLWSQPGLFNWDRIDPGSQVLLTHLPPLAGRGADLGCGIGVLARAVRLKPNPPAIILIDIDQRAIAMAERNIPGANFLGANVQTDGVTALWADVRTSTALPTGLDFVVTNPPFHDGGEEDTELGQAFIQKAASMLKPGGVLWLTANRHLPYEATLKPLFQTVEQIAQAHGFKIYCARKAPLTAKAAPVKSKSAKTRR